VLYRYQPGAYESRGGDAELRRRQQQVYEWARQDGVLDQARKREVPEAAKSFLAGLSDVLLRTEYAAAGFMDVLAGGDGVEEAGKRYVTEILGGTKLGGLFSLEERDRKKLEMEEFLERRGWEEGEKLSSVIGDDWLLTRYVDPSWRDVAALGLSIATDPTTYFTVGAGGATKWVGRAGTLNVTAKTRAAVEKQAQAVIRRQAREAGVENAAKRPMQEVEKELFQKQYHDHLMKRVVEENNELLIRDVNEKAARMSVGADYTGDAAKELRDRLFDEAVEERVQRKIGALGNQMERLSFQRGFENTNRVREGLQRREVDRLLAKQRAGEDIGDLATAFAVRYFGKEVPGTAAAFRQMRNFTHELLEKGRAGKASGPIVQGIGDFINLIDEGFQRIPRMARKYDAFKVVERRRFAQIQGASRVASDMMYGKGGIFTKTEAKALRGDFRANQALTMFVDTPGDPLKRAIWEKEASRIGLTLTQARELPVRIQRHMDILGAEAVDRGFLSSATVAKRAGRYIPHQLKEQYRNSEALQGKFNFTGGDVKTYKLEREHETMDEFVNVIARGYADPRKYGDDPYRAASDMIEFDVQKLIHDYTKVHYEAVANSNAATDVAAMLATTWQNVFREIGRDFDIEKLGISDRDLAIAQRALKNVDFNGKIDSLDLSAVAKRSPSFRAAFIYEGARRSGSLENLNNFMAHAHKLIEDTDVHAFSNFLRAGKRDPKSGLRGFGQYAEFRFEQGPNKGRMFMVPKGVAEFWKRDEKSVRARLPKVLETMLKHFDILQNTFKRTHTIFFPSFHTRNAISNLAAMAVETNTMAMMNPKHVARVWGAMVNGADYSFKAANGRVYTQQEVRNLMAALDIIPDRMVVDELTGEGKTLFDRLNVLRAEEAGRVPSKASRAIKTVSGIPSKASHYAGKGGQLIENYTRASYFLRQLEQGVDPQTAMTRVKKVLFDYADLSQTHREFTRRLFPFATWTMKNIMLQAENFAMRPGRVNALVRTVNEGERGPEADLLPEFLRGEMKVTHTGAGKVHFISGIDLPVNNLNIIWNGGVGKTFREHFNMFSPLLKAPLEIGLNLDTFSMQPISGRRWLGQTGPLIEKGWPEWAKNFVQLESIETADGRKLYKANGARMYALQKNLFVGRMSNEMTNVLSFAADIADGDVQNGSAQLMRLLTGMRLDDISFAEGQRDRLRANVRRLEQFLVEQGGASEFTRVFRPKSRQLQMGGGMTPFF
jgi:hypothetical protein